jgi:hypothetical protein
MGEDNDLSDDIFDAEDYFTEAKAIITSAAFEADARRRLEDHLERLRLKKLIQDYDFDM